MRQVWWKKQVGPRSNENVDGSVAGERVIVGEIWRRVYLTKEWIGRWLGLFRSAFCEIGKNECGVLGNLNGDLGVPFKERGFLYAKW